jgi:fructose 1,6-bisphosphate aldolase/phosphatase
MVTLSIIRADKGGFGGHSAMYPAMVAEAEVVLGRAPGTLLIGGPVATCGDDLSLIRTHAHGIDAAPIHTFAWDVLAAMTQISKDLGLYSAGQDILTDAFSRNHADETEREGMQA